MQIPKTVRAAVLAALVASPLALGLCAGCAQLPQIKSAFDLGVELCQLYFAQHPVTGFSVREVCAIAEVNQPFVDQILSEQTAESGARGAAALAR